MVSLSHNVFEALIGPCRVRAGSVMVAAVSGGPDSMALLCLLSSVRAAIDLDITVVRVEHGLRPEQALEEERLVAQAAGRHGLPFISQQVDVSGYAADHHLSVEHAARELRYAALRKVSQQCRADCIAVAHTADDQAEEVLLRLLRGSGRKGIAGMAFRNKDLVRPLLHTEKKELLSWLEQRGIDYCLDPSNEDPRFLRNRVRHRLLPFLEQQFDPAIGKSLRKTAESLAEDELLLEELTDNAVKKVIRKGITCPDGLSSMRIVRHEFCELHSSLQRRVVERLIWEMGGKAAYDHIMLVVRAALNGRNNSELHLSRGLRVGIYRDYLELSYPQGRLPWRGRLIAYRRQPESEG